MSMLDQIMEEQRKYELTDEYKNLRSNLKIGDVQKLESEIASLKAQLKTKDRLIEIYSNSSNWGTPSGQTGWFEPCEEDELFIKELETVKERGI